MELAKMEKDQVASAGRDDSVYSRGARGNEKDHTTIDIQDGTSEFEPPIVDPYVPLPDDPRPEATEDEDNILRIRAIFVGAILGGVVNAANLYLGLKSGLTFVATLFGSLVGFAVLKSITSVVPENFPILGGKFGPKENTIVQTSATAAGGLSNIFVSAVPAMYQMGLLQNPVGDYGRIATITLGVSFVGFFFATPLRNLFIVQLARPLALVFPTSTATATTIRSLHLATGGERGTKKKIRVLLAAFGAAFILRVVSQFATGILWEWHIFTWIFIWGKYNNQAIWIENWGWYIQWTPAIMGTGMMVGLNTAISIFAGAITSWGIIGPILVRFGEASGLRLMGEDTTSPWADWTTYASMGLKDPVNNPSPRYWLLWPGVLLMVSVSIVEVLCQYQIFQHSAAVLWQGLMSLVIESYKKAGRKPPSWSTKGSRPTQVEDIQERHQIKTWMWMLGLVLAVVVTCISAALQWHMPVGITLISIIIASLFTLIAVLSSGMTDMTPLTAVSKSSQLVLGGLTRNGGYDMTTAETLNCIGGMVASGVANQATDLTADFRVGFLLRTPPRAQWLAQGIASFVAIFLAPAVFIIFAKAYPCILDVTATTCEFSAPSAAAWRAATIAATSPTLPIPRSSGIFAIVLSCFASIMTACKHFVLVGDKAKYRAYMPNWMAFGIMMVVPQPCIAVAIMIGACISVVWQRFWPKNHENYLYSAIAGMISGEGIGGILNAILAIAGVSAGTDIAMPGH